MKRIAFDVSVLDALEPTGVERAAEELLRALAAAAHEFEIVLVSPRHIAESARAAAPHAAAFALSSHAPRGSWRELAAPRFIRRERIALWHSPVAAFPLRARCARIATVHEMAFLEPTFSSRDGEGTFVQRLRFSLAARFATRVLCVSEHTRARFVERYPHAAQRARAVPHGIATAFFAPIPLEPARRRELTGGDEPYVLALGTVREKKDPLAALDAFAHARALLGSPLRLVFAGPAGSQSAELAREIERRELRDCVRIAGFVGDRELPGLLAGARALLHLSRSEGCGLPVLEAQAAAVPVIAARSGALVETAAGGARLVPAGDAVAAAAALLELEGQPTLRRELIERGLANAARRTWVASATATIELWRIALAP